MGDGVWQLGNVEGGPRRFAVRGVLGTFVDIFGSLALLCRSIGLFGRVFVKGRAFVVAVTHVWALYVNIVVFGVPRRSKLDISRLTPFSLGPSP